MKKALLGDHSHVGLGNKQYRHEWIKKQLASIPAGQSILDAGAGECQFKSACVHLKYTSQDFAQYDGKGDGIGIQTSAWDNTKLDIVSDITSIPVEDNSFDNVLCIEVIEHVPAPIEALRELARVLRPGGKLILTAPFCSMTHFAPYHFYTGYNRYFYEKWLPEFGFSIQEVDYNGNYFEYLAQELRYSETAASKYCNGKKMSLKEKIAQKIILAFLKRSSSLDSGSKELMSFGLHIVAIKKQ